MDPHPRQPHGSAFEQYASLNEYRRPGNSTRPPVSLRDPQTLLVLVSSFSLDHGHAARFTVRSVALAAKLDSSGAPIRRLPDGFADPRHRTASGHAAPPPSLLAYACCRRAARLKMLCNCAAAHLHYTGEIAEGGPGGVFQSQKQVIGKNGK
jgi:hypothetical protein